MLEAEILAYLHGVIATGEPPIAAARAAGRDGLGQRVGAVEKRLSNVAHAQCVPIRDLSMCSNFPGAQHGLFDHLIGSRQEHRRHLKVYGTRGVLISAATTKPNLLAGVVR
jgi:hypothetical protein